MIEQLASYFTQHHPDLLTSTQIYQDIGREMYTKFPSIKREGSKPWVGINWNYGNLINYMDIKFGASVIIVLKVYTTSAVTHFYYFLILYTPDLVHTKLILLY